MVYPGVIYGPGNLTAGNVVARLVRLVVMLPLSERSGIDLDFGVRCKIS